MFGSPNGKSPRQQGKEQIVSDSVILVILLILPALLGVIITLANSQTVARYDDKVKDWLTRKDNELAAKQSWIFHFLLKPFVSFLLHICLWTASIQHQGLRAGIRLASYLYILAATLALILIIAYVILIIVVAILVLALILWVIWAMIKGDSEESTARSRSGGTNSSWVTTTLEKEQKDHFSNNPLCPDCDGNVAGDRGNGICGVCHGTGKVSLIDKLQADYEGNIPPHRSTGEICYSCRGTAVCQTCGGSGIAD